MSELTKAQRQIGQRLTPTQRQLGQRFGRLPDDFNMHDIAELFEKLFLRCKGVANRTRPETETEDGYVLYCLGVLKNDIEALVDSYNATVNAIDEAQEDAE